MTEDRSRRSVSPDRVEGSEGPERVAGAVSGQRIPLPKNTRPSTATSAAATSSSRSRWPVSLAYKRHLGGTLASSVERRRLEQGSRMARGLPKGFSIKACCGCFTRLRSFATVASSASLSTASEGRLQAAERTRGEMSMSSGSSFNFPACDRAESRRSPTIPTEDVTIALTGAQLNRRADGAHARASDYCTLG
jgi:hypothetical protein